MGISISIDRMIDEMSRVKRIHSLEISTNRKGYHHLRAEMKWRNGLRAHTV